MDKIKELESTLMQMENELLRSSLERSRGEAQHAYDFINQLADDDVIDIECAKCDDEIDPSIESATL